MRYGVMSPVAYAVLLAGLAAALTFPFAHAQPDHLPFVTIWKTYTANETVAIPLVSSGMTLHWGNGASSTGVSVTATHIYTNLDAYEVSVYGGLEVVSLGGHPGVFNIMSIKQWGDASWMSLADTFRGAYNIVYWATDTPDLSCVTNMSAIFWDATFFNSDISYWDVSSVADMSRMLDFTAFD